MALDLKDLKLVAPDPAWGCVFEDAAKRLRGIPSVAAVEHIGSTAIPGIKAKPVVDVAMAVSVEAGDEVVRCALVALGYVDHGEYGLPGRRFFTLGDPPQVHVHVVNERSPHWRDWIDFRDYLRTHPGLAVAYEHEKERLLAEAQGDRAAYTRAKGDFVAGILAQARDHQSS